MSLKTVVAGSLFALTAVARVPFAAELNLAETPLFVSGSKTALVQLIMERDNKLFFEAYPSYEDINNDGVLDLRYKPDEIDYFGYFDSNFCYANLNTRNLEAISKSSEKKCTGSWSGDYLNYLTMTRMDVMRKTLYGGKRVVLDNVPDNESDKTILRRAFVPWENHTWGIEYNSFAEDGYLITDVSPLGQPVAGRRHLLSTSNVNKDDIPYLRVRENSTQNIWHWVDTEGAQGDGPADVELILDVEVCKEGFLEESCQQYPNDSHKPIGLLHEYGENDSMYFGLLSGSFENNLQGGVLRQSMGSFGTNEVDPLTGEFTATSGIVKTLDAIQIPDDYEDGTTRQRDCPAIPDRAFVNGECRAWGNPVAEMMYEGMRYFSGIRSPTPEFHTTGGMDETLGLPNAEWDDPYSASQPYAQCSSAYQLVISDPSPSFDGDQLPGSDFANPGDNFDDFSGSAANGLHVGKLADFISDNEAALPGLKFIGEVLGDNEDGTPSPKEVTTFRNIRGISPEAPHRKGSYYAPSVAYYGHQNDINPAPGEQTVGNFTLALGSPLPSIDVEVGGRTISFAPFAKTVNFCKQDNDYVPTNAIVGLTVEHHSPAEGSFRISFEDMEQGNDNDLDALARYTYTVTGGQVKMEVDSIEAAGCGIQHLGYTVSGSTQDGVYLVVRDFDTGENKDLDYELDVPPGAKPGSGWDDGKALPLTSSLNFKPSAMPVAEQLLSPLWYAAKWGGFNDDSLDGIPQSNEWDANGDGTPDNYFAVTDPSQMADTMRSVFNRISEEAGVATAVSVSSGSLNTGNKIYRAEFASGIWAGDVISQTISSTGVIDSIPDWSANDALAVKIASGVEREIISFNPASGNGVPFRWPANSAAPQDEEIDSYQVNALARNPITDLQDDRGADRLDYIRGKTIEGFRRRAEPLGDIVHSSPVVVAAPNFFYPDLWGPDAPENSEPYSAFGRANRDRRRVVYAGANDGMLHAFDAGRWQGAEWSSGDGSEIFAYVPSPVYPKLSELSDPGYSHKYYVNATPRPSDVFINGQWRTVLIGALGRGGQGVYALDITDPDSITEGTAEDVVLWEFTDADDADVGFMYSSPVIARMHNGRWAAIVANGYNNSAQNEGYQRGGGASSIMIIDIETGQLTRKLFSSDADCEGSQATPNGMAEPTAVDLDADNIIDAVYAGDLYGCVYRFDVSSSEPTDWPEGEVKHRAVDDDGNRTPITSAISVGSHPTGLGALLYFGTGKYLEPADQRSQAPQRVYAVWDKGPNTSTASLTAISANNMLQQSIVNEETFEFDTNDDGIDDDFVEIRESSNHDIDWSRHEGWYLNLVYQVPQGEQVLATPVLRDGNILLSTHIPTGDECVPEQQGWLMLLSAVNGGMPVSGLLDLNGDSQFRDRPVSGIRGKVNPFSPPALAAAADSDVIITQTELDPEPKTISLASTFIDGRLTWRELEP